jgi:ankyrin repeat protein
MEAARGESVPTMRFFFEHTPADVNWVVDGWRPIQIAARNGSLGLVKYLASLPGVNLNEPTEQGGLALHQAAAGGHADVVAFLLTLDGIDINARDTKGNTALHWAARWSQLDITRILLDCPGIDTAATDERNRMGKWVLESVLGVFPRCRLDRPFLVGLERSMASSRSW